jgi:hypothetical protein
MKFRCALKKIATVGLLLSTVACGNRAISPLQSPQNSPLSTPVQPTSTTSGILPTITPNLIATAAASSAVGQTTPSTKSTSDAVLATVTALASTPTKAPTNTPRPNRTPSGAGPNDVPTSVIAQGGVRIESFSPQVFRGGAASVSVKTVAGAECTLNRVKGANGVLTLERVPNVPSRQAGSNGGLAWIWTIAGDEKNGQILFAVQCGNAGSAQFELLVVS